MITVRYIGANTKSWTLKSPAGERRYVVEPGALIEVHDDDAALVSNPEHWERVQPAAPRKSKAVTDGEVGQ